jgi:hypothetical protein
LSWACLSRRASEYRAASIVAMVASSADAWPACLACQPSARAARMGIVVMIRTCDVRPGARHTTHVVHRPVHAAVHWPARVAPRTWRRLINEIFLIAGLAVTYEEIRDPRSPPSGAGSRPRRRSRSR